MLNLDLPPSDDLIPMTADERLLYEQVVPADHFLRRLLQAVDFQSFLPLLAAAYSPDQGRKPLDPVVLLKLEVLARQYNLSDRQVLAGARLNLAYRLFLGLSLKSPLPHHTLLTYFRRRLGPARLQPIFDALVGQARRARRVGRRAVRAGGRPQPPREGQLLPGRTAVGSGSPPGQTFAWMMPQSPSHLCTAEDFFSCLPVLRGRGAGERGL